jgi:tetratricopeptide (TPR) repeat protein
LAGRYNAKGMFKEAIAEAEKALALDPKWGAMLNSLGFFYIRDGQPAKGEEILKRAAALAPNEPNPLDSLGAMCYGDGRLEEAVAYYKRALEVKADFGSDETIAYIEAIRGDYREATAWIDRFIQGSPNPERKARGYFWQAVFDHLSGKRVRASREMETLRRFAASSRNPAVASLAPLGEMVLFFDVGAYGDAAQRLEQAEGAVLDYFRSHESLALPLIEALADYERNLVSGFAAAREGRPAAAREYADNAAALWPKSEQARLGRDLPLKLALVRLRADISILEGKPADALALMEKDYRPEIMGFGALYLPGNYVFLNFPLDQDTVPRALMKMGDIDGAIQAYRALLEFDPKKSDRRIHIPIYHYRLAKLYNTKGLAAEARREFENLIADWKDADPAIPELIEAKKLGGI